MNPKKIFDFIGERNPKYKLDNFLKSKQNEYPNNTRDYSDYPDIDEYQFGNLVKFIDNPSEELQLYVITRLGPYSIRFINNPTERVQLIAVGKNPYVINSINNATEKVQMTLLEKNIYHISSLKNPSENAQLYVVNQEPELIMTIKNPTELVQILAVKKDPRNYLFITNPAESVTNLYNKILKDRKIPHDNILYLKTQEIIKKMNKNK